MSERKRPTPDIPASPEQLVKTELPLIIMRPISTAELVKRWNKVHDMERISLTQVFCNENNTTPLFPKAEVTLALSPDSGQYQIDEKIGIRAQLKAKGLFAIEDDDLSMHKEKCIGVIAPPLYTAEGENTSVDFFEDSSKIHSREKESAASSDKDTQHAAVELIRSEELFRQYQLADKIFNLLPPGFNNIDGIKSQYERLVNAYNSGDYALTHQAYGGFMNVLRKAAESKPGVMRDTLATAWDEILLEEQVEHYLRNQIQAPMLISQLPIHQMSDAARDRMLANTNAADIRKVFEYVDLAMRPNLSAIASRLPSEIQDLFSPDLDSQGLLPGKVLKERIKTYLDLKLQEGLLPPDLLVAFKSWQEHIVHSLQIFGDKVDKMSFGEHVQNIDKLFTISPDDPSIPRRYLRQLTRVSQPDEVIIAAWGFNQYDASENSSEENINNRQLLFTFPQGLRIEKEYSERTTVSSYPWRRVFSVTMQSGAKQFVNTEENSNKKFAIARGSENGISSAYNGKKVDIGPISLERHELPVTYNGKPLRLLVTVRNKRDVSHHRKILERGDWAVKDHYANSIIVDTTGPEFEDLSEQQKIEFGIEVGDFFDKAMMQTALNMHLEYEREELKDQRRTAKATGGSGASGGGYRVMKYYAVVDWQHELAGGPGKQSEETVRMEVCHYPSVEEYRRKLLGEGGAVGDDEYALKRWFVPASDSTVPLIDLFAPKKIFHKYKPQKNGNGSGKPTQH